MQDPGDADGGAGGVEIGGDFVDDGGEFGERGVLGCCRGEETGVHRAKGHTAQFFALE